MVLSKLNKNVAEKLYSGALLFFNINKFLDKGNNNEMILFPNYSHYYSYPEFGKIWHNTDKKHQYHKIILKCNICKEEPDRNFAGIGNLNIINEKDGLLTLICNKCAKLHNYKYFKINKNKQLSLF
jgi:hypothetical protein